MFLAKGFKQHFGAVIKQVGLFLRMISGTQDSERIARLILCHATSFVVLHIWAAIV